MKTFSAEEIQKIVNGKIIQGSPDLIINGAAHYVEQIKKPNMLLFLRRSIKIDFEKISNNLPCTIIVDKELAPLKSIDGCTVILVKDISKAFWKFVYYYRNLFEIPIIAVTGTCGKSTTKDMILHMLKHQWNIHGTTGSANSRTQNLIYLLGIDESTDAAVFETPVGKPGDITNSCKYFKPSIGIITNISPDHMEGCKTMDAYIKAKGEMLSCIDANGLLIINGDDENIKKLDFDVFKGRVVTFGIHSPADFKASNIQYAENGMKFTLHFHNIRYNIFVPGYGEHQVSNALAALTAVHELGIGMKEASEFLQTFKNLPLHIQVEPGINGSTIIKDSWNINPSSLKAAIKVLTGIAKGKKQIAVIGDINALGDQALELHLQVGDMIVKSGEIDILITIGPLTAETAKQALKSGFKGEVYSFPDVEGIYDLLKNKLNSNTILLIKSAGYHDKTILDLGLKLINPENTRLYLP